MSTPTNYSDFENIPISFTNKNYDTKNLICIETGHFVSGLLERGLSKKNYETLNDAIQASQTIEEFNNKIQEERNKREKVNIFVGLYPDKKTVLEDSIKNNNSKKRTKIPKTIRVTRVVACYYDLENNLKLLTEFYENNSDNNFQTIISLLIKLCEKDIFKGKTINICLQSSQISIKYFVKYKIYRSFINKYKIGYDKLTDFFELDEESFNALNDHTYVKEFSKLENLLKEKDMMFDAIIDYDECQEEYKNISLLFNIMKLNSNAREIQFKRLNKNKQISTNNENNIENLDEENIIEKKLKTN